MMMTTVDYADANKSTLCDHHQGQGHQQILGRATTRESSSITSRHRVGRSSRGILMVLSSSPAMRRQQRLLILLLFLSCSFICHRKPSASSFLFVASFDAHPLATPTSESDEQQTTTETRKNSPILKEEVHEHQQKSGSSILGRLLQRKETANSDNAADSVEDSIYDPLQGDNECVTDQESGNTSCTVSYAPPDSTIEIVRVPQKIDATCSYGGADPDDDGNKKEVCQAGEEVMTEVDKHWGSDPAILRMRDQLRLTGSGCVNAATAKLSESQKPPVEDASSKRGRRNSDDVNRRPPIFLMPGLASTRLVAWRFKSCSHRLHSDIKVQDYVWLNINLIMQMSTIDVSCMRECLQLGLNQTDMDDLAVGCKLRPDEGLDAISSLSPGGIGSQLLVGGTNTVYAWLIQWLADNLGYDVSNIVGLPYDWRLSPDKMEQRDGFLTLTRRRIEAAVQSNGEPGIMVAHSMGNVIFRYFLQWLRNELQEEAYDRFIRKVKRRAQAKANAASATSVLPFWMKNVDGTEEDILQAIKEGGRHEKLWELGQMEGESNWYEWIETHIWTYVGLSAPLLGAPNPLRAVISG